MKTHELQTAFSSYTTDQVLGNGGNGIVYAARSDSGAEVAVKLFVNERGSSTKLKRFKNEYGFCARNSHPNVIKVLDVGVAPASLKNAPFFVMPRYASSLKKYLEETRPHDELLAIFAQILDGVEAAHLLGVTHRDLKPENILLNNATNVVVADFGIAHFSEADLLTAVETQAGEKLANFMYAAPEQRRKGELVDVRADIFALGLMLNEFFTREVPHGYGFKMVSSVAPEKAWVDEVVSAMIQATPANRPRSIAEVRHAISRASGVFLENQRLNNLKNTVIKQSSIDDDLAQNPPILVDASYRAGALTLALDRPVSQGWVDALHNMGNYTSVMGIPPTAFRFSSNRSTVSVSEHTAQDVIDYFKQWLPTATAVYRQNLLREARLREEQERETILRERKRIEREQAVNSSLRI